MVAHDSRQLVEALVADCAHAPLAPDVVVEDRAQGITLCGQASAQRFFCSFSVDGLCCTRIEVRCVVADETMAAMEYVFYGRHMGVFAGIPATGRGVTLPLALICRIVDRQVCRVSLYYDAGTLLRQLGMAL